MPPPVTVDEEELRKAIEAALQEGYPPPGKPGVMSAVGVAARRLNICRSTVSSIMSRWKASGREPDWTLWKRPGSRPLPTPKVALFQLRDTILRLLASGREVSLETLAMAAGVSEAHVKNELREMRAAGYRLRLSADAAMIDLSRPLPKAEDGEYAATFTTDGAGEITFGFVSDIHVGSKYFREDVLADIFRRFADDGVRNVVVPGNYLEGERASADHRRDLTQHGLEAQVDALVQAWPALKDTTTYALWGDDHEGWWAQSIGLDVGAYVEAAFRRAGRADWIDIGFRQSPLLVQHAVTGKASVVMVDHPGGGSAYAVSYRPQKIVEAFGPGEKPDVIIMGHYHKMEFLNVRGVWVVQAGCVQDQTRFMGKIPTEAHIGGGTLTMRLDPATGATVEAAVRFYRYFGRGYYAGRWSLHGSPKRIPLKKGAQRH